MSREARAIADDPADALSYALDALDRGESGASSALLPLVYDELRRLAAQRLRREPPGQTVEATALVHEAYLRLIGGDRAQPWNGRGHFFAAAAEAMRRILVETARRKCRARHGGGVDRVEFELDGLEAASVDDAVARDDDLLALDAALRGLEAEQPEAARLVSLRHFAGLTIEQAAEAMGVSIRTANRHWAYARAWLFDRLRSPSEID